MNSVAQFNALDGKIISKEDLLLIQQKALKEKQLEVHKRITVLFVNHPDADLFELKINPPAVFRPSVEPVKALAAPNIDFNPESLGIPYLSAAQEAALIGTDPKSLGKPVTTNDIYDMVTQQIISSIEQNGDLIWYNGRDQEGKKDKSVFLPMPINFGSKKYYRGINTLLLSMYATKVEKKGYHTRKVKMITDDRLFWMTFKQIEAAGAKLKKGAVSMPAVFYNWVFKDGDKTIKEAEYYKLRATYKCGTKDSDAEKCSDLLKLPFLRYYNVYNERDIEGIDFAAAREKLKKEAAMVSIDTDVEKIEAAEAIINNMPKKPVIVERHIGRGQSPNYKPLTDIVEMPQKEQYSNVAIWYGTAFHELTHATGHESRIGRVGVTKFDSFGSPQYAFEELIAELGSAFLNSESGILFHTLKKNSAYIKGWQNSVVGMLKEDNKAIFKAAGAAQKAADYILDRDAKGIPAYLKNMVQREGKKENKDNGPLEGLTVSEFKKKYNIPNLYTHYENVLITRTNSDLAIDFYKIGPDHFIGFAEDGAVVNSMAKGDKEEFIHRHQRVYVIKDDLAKVMKQLNDADFEVTVYDISKKEPKTKADASKKGKVTSKYTYERFTADLPPLKTIELSYRGISFSEEKRAKSEVKEWGDELVSIYNDKLKKAEKKDRVAEFHETFDLLYPRFLKRKLTIISRRSGLLSTMITGGSNFPVRSQKKKQDSYHNALTDYIDYANYFSDKLNKAIFKSEAIKSGESDTLEKLREKLAELQKNHEIMKNANVAHREYMKEKDISIFEKYGFKTELINAIIESKTKPIASYSLTNSLARIKDVEQRIKIEEKRAERYVGGNKSSKYGDLEVIENVDENRLQLVFEGKPDENTRAVLKSHGFRWSPKNKAWQRQLTTNALYSLKRYVLPELGIDPGLSAPTAQNQDTISFNKQILKAKKNGFKPSQKFDLGNSKEQLLSHLGKKKIILLGATIKKAMTKNDSHLLRWDHLINLPDRINNPLAIFKSKTSGFVILTELINEKEKPIMVAIHADETLKINEIKSMYSRKNDKTYQNWENEGLLLFKDKKSDLLGRVFLGTIPNSPNKSLSTSKNTKISVNTKKNNPKRLGVVMIPTTPQPTIPNNNPVVPMVIEPVLEELSEAAPIAEKPSVKRPSNPYIQNVRDTKQIANNAQYFDLQGAFIDFTGKLEQKTDDSLVITLDAPPGAGKTRSVFQFLNLAANGGMPSIFASLEEHPTSKIFHDKREMYIDPKNEDYIDTIGELPPTYAEFLKLVEPYPIIAIDSWNKVFETYKGIDFDRDLRKAFNGKIIVCIFQRTGTGGMRGGSKAGFDGDIILEIVKADNYMDSYVIARKNRYQDIPLNEIGYNFYHQKVINPEMLHAHSGVPSEVLI